MTKSVRPLPSRPGAFARFVPARLRSVWRDALSLLLAIGDQRTPASARLIAGLALLYTVSPLDLLPDSIPFIGYGDDLLIVPALLAFAARSLPADVLALSRFKADAFAARRRWLVPTILRMLVLLSLGLAYLAIHGLLSLMN